MAYWSLDDIPWCEFDAAKVTPELLSLVKAASLVEHNGYDYARYLGEVFADDEAFQNIAQQWAAEEVQHGKVLRKWAELADPSFDFDKSFKLFTENYQLPVNVAHSVRGSRCGELVARCVVEVGTSSYYTAMKEYTDEPVLKAISAKIAADELRHYKLFYSSLKDYLEKEKVGPLARLRIALGRIAESEDDELAYAFYASHRKDESEIYVRKHYTRRYWACASMLYRKPHIERMVPMVFKAAGLKPNGWLNRAMNHLAWALLRLRASSVRQYRPDRMAA